MLWVLVGGCVVVVGLFCGFLVVLCFRLCCVGLWCWWWWLWVLGFGWVVVCCGVCFDFCVLFFVVVGWWGGWCFGVVGLGVCWWVFFVWLFFLVVGGCRWGFVGGVCWGCVVRVCVLGMVVVGWVMCVCWCVVWWWVCGCDGMWGGIRS
uniref:NADH dehydrogenase subunit 6 n=1 Tax=Knipowitschia caucasica TaxID=637954 RepID=A0AAV2L4W9_KNICA